MFRVIRNVNAFYMLIAIEKTRDIAISQWHFWAEQMSLMPEEEFVSLQSVKSNF